MCAYKEVPDCSFDYDAGEYIGNTADVRKRNRPPCNRRPCNAEASYQTKDVIGDVRKIRMSNSCLLKSYDVPLFQFGSLFQCIRKSSLKNFDWTKASNRNILHKNNLRTAAIIVYGNRWTPGSWYIVSKLRCIVQRWKKSENWHAK